MPERPVLSPRVKPGDRPTRDQFYVPGYTGNVDPRRPTLGLRGPLKEALSAALIKDQRALSQFPE